MKCVILCLILLSWAMCGIFAFRILMRDMINKKYYAYEPEDSLILFSFTVGGYAALLTMLMFRLSKSQICRKTIEKIVGKDMVNKEDK